MIPLIRKPSQAISSKPIPFSRYQQKVRRILAIHDIIGEVKEFVQSLGNEHPVFSQMSDIDANVSDTEIASVQYGKSRGRPYPVSSTSIGSNNNQD